MFSPSKFLAAPGRAVWTMSVVMVAGTLLAMPTAMSADLGADVTAASAPVYANDPLMVTIDRAKVVRIARSADTIIIGNPAIADATIQDAQTIVLTGRAFGMTNMIILDANGDPIVDETIVVRGHETNTVRIYRQSVRETLACAPVCEPTLTIGDDQSAFSRAEKQIGQRNSLSDKAASSR